MSDDTCRPSGQLYAASQTDIGFADFKRAKNREFRDWLEPLDGLSDQSPTSISRYASQYLQDLTTLCHDLQMLLWLGEREIGWCHERLHQNAAEHDWVLNKLASAFETVALAVRVVQHDRSLQVDSEALLRIAHDAREMFDAPRDTRIDNLHDRAGLRYVIEARYAEGDGFSQLRQDLSTLEAVLQQPNLPDCHHSPSFRTVTWFGKTFELTPMQAAVIQILWEAHYQGIRGLSQATILEQAGSKGSQLSDVFKRGGKKPVFDQMIEKVTKDLFRLKNYDMG